MASVTSDFGRARAVFAEIPEAERHAKCVELAADFAIRDEPHPFDGGPCRIARWGGGLYALLARISDYPTSDLEQRLVNACLLSMLMKGCT